MTEEEESDVPQSLVDACGRNDLQFVRYYMEHAADPNEADKLGHTPMEMAIKHDSVPMCKYLLNVSKQFQHSYNWVCTCLSNIP